MRLKNALFVALVLVMFGPAVYAVEFRSDETVHIPSGTIINDDLAVAGSNLSVGATINGDLHAAGGSVDISGPVSQSSMVAGGDITIGGRTANDLYAAGGQADVTGTVGQDAWVSGGTVTIKNSAKINRDLVAGAGNLLMDGTVGRNLYVGAGTAHINGTVGGNAQVQSGDVRLGPKALIRGNLIVSGDNQVQMAPGAQVLGTTTYKPGPVQPAKPTPGSRFGLWLYSLLAMYAVGALMLALMPRLSVAAADRVASAP